jgi:hypothetical protein
LWYDYYDAGTGVTAPGGTAQMNRGYLILLRAPPGSIPKGAGILIIPGEEIKFQTKRSIIG